MLATSPSQGAFIDAFAARYRDARGRRRWAEKTPLNVRHIPWILERFPEARFIHVVRDGRDVVCSMRQHPDRRWVDGAWVKVHRPLSLEQYAERWVADTEAGVAHRGDPRYLEVRYEDLVQDPLAVLRGMLMDLGEEFDPAILVEPDAEPGPDGRHHAGTAISTRSMGRWRTDLTSEEQAVVQRIAGATLRPPGLPGRLRRPEGSGGLAERAPAAGADPRRDAGAGLAVHLERLEVDLVPAMRADAVHAHGLGVEATHRGLAAEVTGACHAVSILVRGEGLLHRGTGRTLRPRTIPNADARGRREGRQSCNDVPWHPASATPTSPAMRG